MNKNLWSLDELVSNVDRMVEDAAYNLSRPTKNPAIRRKNKNIFDSLFSIQHYLKELQTIKAKSAPELYTAIIASQEILAKYVYPDSGITPDECINQLLDVLDDKKLVSATKKS